MDVSLRLPGELRYVDVARLVAGGAAARLDFGFDAVDDIQLAIESVLSARIVAGDEIRVELAVRDGSLAVWLGPLAAAGLGARLHDDGPGIALARVLGALVDEAEPEERGGLPGLVLRRRLPAP